MNQDRRATKHLLEFLICKREPTLEELRDLAPGLYPPVLAQDGLAAAIEAHARRMPVSVNVVAGDRVEVLGGQLSVQAAPGKGTVIEGAIPISRQTAPDAVGRASAHA